MTISLTELGRAALGRRRDWAVRRPVVSRPRPGVHWVGPAAMVATVVACWPPMAGALGEEGGSVSFGLFIGAVSIVLMAWSFVLAVRLRWMEPFFGGLDRMYRAHRWTGALAVGAMFWHTSAEPEIEGGIRGAARATAEAAEGLASIGEVMLYGLVAISLLRWFPYRWWRWTHKLLGVPFAFASWHFFTAEKPYANGSPWGWWFDGVMLVGLVAWLWRVVVRDAVAHGTRYRITGVERRGPVTELALSPLGRPIGQRLGQFVVIKIQAPGLSEPHMFTVASPPESDELRLFIKDLGDWTAKIQRADLVGADVLVEGPYGAFEPLPHQDRPVVWVAGGVGITPFLAAVETLSPTEIERRPLLVYCVRDHETAVAVDRLEAAQDQGRIRLELVESSVGRRFVAEELSALAPLAGAHVAVCGPASLVAEVAAEARRRGAAQVETEDFDIRSGIGPDLSRLVDEAVSGRSGSTPAPVS